MGIKTVLFTCMLITCLYVQSTVAQTCNQYSFNSNQNFQTCTDLPVLSSYLHWTYHEANNTADIAFRKTGITTSNWVAWALNPSRPDMSGSQALVAYQHSNGSTIAYTTSIPNTSPSMTPSSLSFGVTNLNAEYLSSGEIIIFATLQLDSSLVNTNQVWQFGPLSNDAPAIHSMSSDNQASVGSINFQTGVTTAGGGSNSRDSKKNVHGVLNAVSWGILMPIGIMIARYVKVFNWGTPAWFYAHITCQASAYILGVAGWGTGLKLGSDSVGITYHKHRNIGITLFCFATLQVFALLLRPKPDHKYRLYWNLYHWSIGYATITLGIINIYEGLDILVPDKKWKDAYTGIIISLGGIAALLEALTWIIVIKRKKTAGSDNKHVNGANGVHGHDGRFQQNA